jgi:hypothetical protein
MSRDCFFPDLPPETAFTRPLAARLARLRVRDPHELTDRRNP